MATTYQAQLPFLDRYQRIEVLDRVEGFLPATKPEQVEALALESYPARIGGAAKHLAEIVRHQTGVNTEDPLGAARKITRSYIDWAKDAKASGHNLGILAADLDEVMNPELAMAVVVDTEHLGVRPLLRFFDLSMLRHDGHIRGVGYDPQNVNYGQENGGLTEHVLQALDSWRVGQVKRALPVARRSEANRFALWASKLVEVSERYPVLHAIAEGGLDEIHDRVKV